MAEETRQQRAARTAARRREEIRRRIYQGETIEQIADALGMTEETVGGYVRQLGLVEFKPAAPYFCEGCQNQVAYRPCSICFALAASPGRLGVRAQIDPADDLPRSPLSREGAGR